MIFFSFILVDYQTGLRKKYLVTGDRSQSTVIVAVCYIKTFQRYDFFRLFTLRVVNNNNNINNNNNNNNGKEPSQTVYIQVR